MDAELSPQTVEAMTAVFGPEPDAPVAAETTEAPASAAPAVATPSPADEKASARILANTRAERKAAEQRREMAAESAKIAASRAELAELAKVADQVKAAKSSPSELLKLSGLEPRAFLEALAGEHEPSAIAARAVESTKTEVEQLKERLAAFERAQEDAARAARSHEVNAAVAATQSAFVEHVADNAAKYPSLVEAWTPREIARRGLALAEEHSEAYKSAYGEYPDDDVLAEHLNEMAKAELEETEKERTAWRARIGKSAPMPSKGGNGTGEKPAAQMDQGLSPRTLTSRAVSVKASAPKPWSQESADEESIRILKSSTGSRSSTAD